MSLTTQTRSHSDRPMRPVLESGEEVTVYIDPMTENRAEGQAELISLAQLTAPDHAVEHWWVRFLEDPPGDEHYRAVRVDDDGRNIQRRDVFDGN